MRIQILILGFKGLTYPQFDYCKSHIMALDYWDQLSEVLKENHVFPEYLVFKYFKNTWSALWRSGESIVYVSQGHPTRI